MGLGLGEKMPLTESMKCRKPGRGFMSTLELKSRKMAVPEGNHKRYRLSDKPAC